jgi:hypothetical protein
MQVRRERKETKKENGERVSGVIIITTNHRFICFSPLRAGRLEAAGAIVAQNTHTYIYYIYLSHQILDYS